MRRINITVLIVVLTALVACSSKAPEKTSPDNVETTAEALTGLTKGQVCATTSQCATGLTCVDTVCCENACGGGARDNQVCSNVYGNVMPDNQVGTCITLTTGQPCGSLVNENPCQWRGSNLNGGQNCPSPNAGDPIHACYTCSSSTCPAAYPVC